MINHKHPILRIFLFLAIFFSVGNMSAQTDFLFVVDNSGSISPAEFDAFADIIMETGEALDANCSPSEYAIVHYGGAFGQEYTIQNDFVAWNNTSMVNRIYQDCNTSGTSDCGDDLFAVFGSIDNEWGTGLNPTTGSDLIVVIFTDADGMSQGQNNMSPCNFPACSTILPSTNFSSFMNSIAGSSSYVIGVEDTDNEGLLQQYLHGSGSYVPIDLADDPAAVAATVSSSIECSSPVVGIAKNLTALTNNMDGTYTVEYLLTVENFSSFALNTLEVFDDITGQFSGYMPTNFMAISGSLNASTSWNGTATSNVLVTGQSIAATATGTVSVKFDFTHDGFENTVDNVASISGMSPSGMMLTDDSTDGLNPDPNGDGLPSEMVPTTIMLPEIAEMGIAKNLTNVTDNNDGTYTVQFMFTVENVSLIPLSNLEVYDDIVSQFSVYMPSNFMAINGTLNGNSAWNGTAASNVLAAGQSIAAGTSQNISISFDVIHTGFAAMVLNTATIVGTTPTNQTLMDTSTDGINPDPNNDGVPSEQVPTPLTLPEIADIGLAKNLTSLTDNNDGTYTIEFLLTMENFSLIPLSDIKIYDDIISQFAVYSPANFMAIDGSLLSNSSWTGGANSNVLSPGQTLAAGDSKTVSLKFDITHNGLSNTVENVATIEGTTPSNQTITDTSTNGLNPDPDGNGEPTEMVPTPLVLPEIAVIGIAKELTNLTNNNDGTFTVEYQLAVENFSLIPFTNLVVWDDIITRFASVSPSNFVAITETLIADSGWNGTASSNILLAGQSIAAGEKKTVAIKFDIVHNGLATTIDNHSVVEGTTPSNMTVTDNSTDGTDPDPNDDKNPDEEMPTSITFPELGAIGLAKNLTSLTGNPDNSYTVEYLLTIENFALFTMDDLELYDDVVTEFAGYSPMNFMIIDGSLVGNTLWNGTATSNILGTGQSIAAGAVETVSIKFDLIPTGIMTTMFNTAMVVGYSPSDTPYTDNSYNGLDPDPYGNGDPGEEMPTPVVLPMFGMVSGTVWKDTDADGLNNNNELGLFWVMVELVDCNGGVIASGFTDQDGNYAFSNVPPGQYMLNFDTNLLPDGCEFTFPNVGTDDTIDSDVDSNGSTGCFPIATNDDLDFDAGLYSLGTIGDRLWEDVNGNGIQDFGEPGINGVMVELYDAAGNVVDSMPTIGNGNYFFEQVFPGFYYVKYNVPAGYYSTSPFAGSNQTSDSNVDGSFGLNTTPLFELLPAEMDLDIDGGFYMHTLIGETVFFDLNKNNLFDSNENGINGMSVELWKIENGQQVKVAEQMTHHKPGSASDDGYFKFSVPPGEYFVVMNIPDLGLVPVTQNAQGYTPLTNANESLIDSDVNSANTTESFQINSGQDICNIGAGYYPMGTIGNRTWADNNYDGIQNGNEPSLSGIKVKAYNTAGVMIGSDESDATGTYMIDYLGQDDYYLEFTPPTGYLATTPKVGADNADSDIDDSNGLNTTPTYVVNSGDNLINVDGGFVLSVVPVEWLSFTGEVRGDFNVLSWQTASEINASHFYIERSETGTSNFEDIGKVEACGKSNSINDYNFEDKDVLNNEVYFYRLRQVDYNGNFSHSDILSLRRKLINTVAVYPNPVVDQLNLEFNLETATNVSLALYDVQGKLITNLINTELKKGTANKSFDVKTLSSGTYLVQGTIGTEAYSKKVIVY